MAETKDKVVSTKTETAEIKAVSTPKETSKTTKRTTSTKPKNLRLQDIDKDILVTFKNNTNGGLTYKDRKTSNIFYLEKYGDTDTLSVEEIITLRNTARGFLDNYWMLFTEIDSKDVTLDQLHEALGVSDLYSGDNAVMVDMDGLILGDAKKFKDAYLKLDDKRQGYIFARAAKLLKDKEVKDVDTLNVIKELEQLREDKKNAPKDEKK